MIIQCPRCSTRWRVPSRAPVENPSFKCGRCHHLFRQFPGAPAAGDAKTHGERTRAATPDPDTMEFIFPDRVRKAPDPQIVPAPVTEPPTQKIVRSAAAVAAPDTAAKPEPVADPVEVIVHTAVVNDSTAVEAIDRAELEEEGKRYVAHDDAPHDDGFPAASPDVSAHPTAAAEEDTFSDEDAWEIPLALGQDAGQVLRPEPTMTPASVLSVFGRSMATVVAVLGVLALTMRIAPDASREWLARIPLIGPSLARDQVLASSVLLENVSGGYQRLRNGRRVFVIAGDAFNNSIAPIERIEIEGALYGVTGELDQKVVSAGNRTTVTDLSEAEIAFLQGLDPRTLVAPGERTSFLIVFLEPPRDLREFSSRVLNARPTRRAATVPPFEKARHPASVG